MVVGIDGSGGSLHALRWAAHRTARFGSLQPVMTWQYPWWAYSSPMPPPVDDFHNQASQAAERALDGLRDVTTAPPIVCRGHAGQTLVEVGATANLIVVGTRGHGGVIDTLLGSVSSHVVANSTVPVAVIPSDAPIDAATRRVVVGVDGSVHALQALIWALKHTPADATVEAVHSWTYQVDPDPSGMSPVSYQACEARAQEVLDKAIASATYAAGDDRPEVVGRLVYGDARPNLRDLTANADLLVLGARGRGGFAHLLLGSVTTALIHQPSLATVVVPATEH